MSTTSTGARNGGTAVACQGVVEKILYANSDTDFVVAVLRRSDDDSEEVIVGAVPELSVGETLRVAGRKTVHERHGWRVRIENYERILPATSRGILMYLSSGLVKGIGPKLAKNLVSAFGDRTLDVIEGRPEELLEVEGIGRKRQRDIVAAWRRQRDIHNVMMFLQEHGIGLAQSHKIYKRYGGQAIEVVRRNPYLLAKDVRGIGFKKADQIAGALGIEKDSPRRLAAGIAHTLDVCAQDGHCCVPFDTLVAKAALLLEAADDAVRAAIEAAEKDGDVVIADWPDKPVYAPRLFESENAVARRLLALLNAPGRDQRIDVPKALQWAEKRMGVALTDGQKRAIAGALSQKVCVITGGPGVGKTTIVRAVAEILKAKGCRVALAAPTGRAAKRLEELTGAEAQTIHRLLRYNPIKGGFEAGPEDPIDCDTVILDETSMLDVVLAGDLFAAAPDRASIVLVGDADQLPPVGPGKVLADMIRSDAFPVFRLDEIFRQCLRSDIIRNAHRINAGELPELDAAKSRDFFFIAQDDPVRAVETIKELVSRRMPAKFGFDPFRDIQVLSPMHRGPCGIDNLNAVLQECLNPTGAPIAQHGTRFRKGDRVMQVVNNYDKDVYNGDVGAIVGANRIEQTIQVDLGRGAVNYDRTDLDELTLAYAVSIHKSQGSEYPAVVIPLYTQHYMMLARKLLYTAVTRGKRLVVIVGTHKALALAVRNEAYGQRYTLLSERLNRRTDATSISDARA